jgi:hypothetical protein
MARKTLLQGDPSGNIYARTVATPSTTTPTSVSTGFTTAWENAVIVQRKESHANTWEAKFAFAKLARQMNRIAI